MNRPDTAIFVAYDEETPRDTAEAERNLMRAILQTAMDDVRKSGDLYRDARNYLLSNADFYVFSFRSICAHLNLCPTTIRRQCGLIADDRDRLAA